jgi:hypothetical protein
VVLNFTPRAKDGRSYYDYGGYTEYNAYGLPKAPTYAAS